MLERAEPAQVIECDGCERNCFMPVNVRPAEGNRPAQAFISCDKPEDVGRILKSGQASAMADHRRDACGRGGPAAGIHQVPHEDSGGKRWTLGR